MRDFITRLWRRTQPPPVNRDLVVADVNAFFASDTYKAALSEIIKAAFEDGARAERARIAAASAAEPDAPARSQSPKSSTPESATSGRTLH